MLLPASVRRRAALHLRRADPVMAAIVRKVGPCRMQIHRGGTTYWHLTRAILRQQISGHAAAAIEKRISARFGGTLQPEDVLGATDAELRALGLSRQKASYLRDLSARANDGLPLDRLARMSEERLVETVTAVRGIGRWTAEMLMMFRQGRPDILPTGDYGIRKAMQVAYRMRALPKPARMQKVAEAWRPYRTLACWYLWRSLDQKP
jgi:3-methyladenine DNA glycosylase/8-oxoguanine DNA glycosylase